MTDEQQPERPRRRGRKPAAEDERKDRIIQTRVPKDLESTLKEAAEQQRVSVSHLIRNVLEDTFQLVDSIVNDSASLVEHVTRDARQLAQSARNLTKSDRADKLTPARDGGKEAQARLDGVAAWQEVVLNRACACINCGIGLSRGDPAFLGLNGDGDTPPVWLCKDCVQTI